jgi:hypothetical protein
VAANPAQWLGTTSLGGLAVFVLAMFVCTNLTIFAHELGHALAGLVLTKGLVILRVGRAPALVRGRLGRLQLELNPLPPQKGRLAGSATTYAHLGRAPYAALILAGPLLGVVVAFVPIEIGAATHLPGLVAAGATGVLFNALNLLPMQRHGRLSDGARLLLALRGARRPARDFDGRVGETMTRWLVLYTDPVNTISPEELLLLGGAPVALGYASDDRGIEAVTLVRLAFAGWCWREAENADRSRVRDAVLDARHRASLEGTSRAHIAVAAARDLAGGRIDLSLGSPTTSSLAEGFRRACGHIRATTPEDKSDFAYRFGVALHDVVRIAG